jgi:hypothetical protein
MLLGRAVAMTAKAGRWIGECVDPIATHTEMDKRIIRRFRRAPGEFRRSFRYGPRLRIAALLHFANRIASVVPTPSD